MRQRCKGTVNTVSVKVIKVNQQLAQSLKKKAKVSQVLSFSKDLMAQPSESKGSSGHGGSTAKWGFFCVWGKQNAGMQELSCISA